MGRPNFLLIMTDQQRADHLGCYGNDVIQTPHIDDLAASGLRFERFYVNNGTCMPNRATLATGRMPSSTGVITNGQALPLEANTFAATLRAAGYATGIVGKSHLQTIAGLQLDDENFPPPRPGVRLAGFEDASLAPLTGPEYEQELGSRWVEDPDRDVADNYYGFESTELALGHGDSVIGHYYRWLRDRHPDPQSLGGPENALPAEGYDAPQAWRTNVPEELYPSTYVEERTISFLERHAADESDKPFFLQCSFPDPHHPFTPPGRYFDMYSPMDVRVSDSFAAHHTDPSPLRDKLERELATDSRITRVQPFACTESEALQSIALTYGMVSMVDDCVGRIIARLHELDLADDTVIIFTSDHGDLMSDHGLMLKHAFHYEGITRVPFIWRDPQASAVGGCTTAMLGATVDIAATILARAGVSAYYGMQGIDVVSAAESGATPDRHGVLIEEDEIPFNANCDVYLRTRTLVTDEWRLTLWVEYGFGELYDLDADPLELVNRWNDPSAAGTRATLTEQMLMQTLALSDVSPRSTACA